VIFVTVGTQLTFDRLVTAVDGWAGAAGRSDVFAQIGPTDLRPRHLGYERFISPAECRERMLGADTIVAHAGMGTILTALEIGTPVIVMPRQAQHGEHRNDHQMATARRLAELDMVTVAFDEVQLAQRLDEVDQLAARPRIESHAPDGLLAGIRAFILDQPALAPAAAESTI